MPSKSPAKQDQIQMEVPASFVAGETDASVSAVAQQDNVRNAGQDEPAAAAAASATASSHSAGLTQGSPGRVYSGLDVLQDGAILQPVPRELAASPPAKNRLAHPPIMLPDGVSLAKPMDRAWTPDGQAGGLLLSSGRPTVSAEAQAAWQQPYAGSGTYISPPPSKLPQPSAAFSAGSSAVALTQQLTGPGQPAQPEPMQISPAKQLLPGVTRAAQHGHQPAHAARQDALLRLLSQRYVQQQGLSSHASAQHSLHAGQQIPEEGDEPVGGLLMPPPPSGLPVESRLLSTSSAGMRLWNAHGHRHCLCVP
jgi:hypothetical protein